MRPRIQGIGGLERGSSLFLVVLWIRFVPILPTCKRIVCQCVEVCVKYRS
jgi:hypothetical protein